MKSQPNITFLSLHLFFLLVSFALCGQTTKINEVNFSKVTITDAFWKPRLQTIATKTLDACIQQTEVKTPRIRNFEKIVNHTNEKHEGIYYDDSDVYKALEAMAYSLKNYPDSKLEKTADHWIDLIVAAQLEDGYLNTYYQLGGIAKRWTDIEKHEDYNAGHLIEAAVAYYNATGKDKLLNTAIRLANHIDSTFRLANKPWFSGHQEIELALMKLYHLTKNERYLLLSEWYLQQRGKRYYPYGTNWITPDYWQDDVPVKDQKEIGGHAVRAMYQYTGTAEVAAATGDESYKKGLHFLWDDVVSRNLYITGGIGSSGKNEGFSFDYDLPNSQAYCETCASVGMVFWNERMNHLTGDSKYIDVLERSLYNGALSGLSLSGDRFFYGNPLASLGNDTRREWFGTACCPANIARLTASVGNYIYGSSATDIWVNLFIGNRANIDVGNKSIPVSIETNYPWEGRVKINLDPGAKTKFTLHVRIPGWVREEPVPGDLYHYKQSKNIQPTLTLNGKSLPYELVDGYAVVDRTWKKGDYVELNLPMEVREVVANAKVKQDEDRIALQRGPLVYCIEGVDNGNNVWNIVMPLENSYQTTFEPSLLAGIVSIQFQATTMTTSSNGNEIIPVQKIVKAIPYYAWSNRGANEMQVWLPTKIKEVRINPEKE